MEKKRSNLTARMGLAVIMSLLCYLSFEPNCHTQNLDDERRRVESLHYENACKTGTIEALNEYIELYPNGTYVEDVRNRISDYNLWDKARRVDTIDAYNDYLKNSKYKKYESQAQGAIMEIKAREAWNSIKTSSDRDAVERFIRDYPNSSYTDAARNRIHEFKAVFFYKNQNYQMAYSEFTSAGGRSALLIGNRTIYDKCVNTLNEINAYNALNANSSQTALNDFLTKYPGSEHYNQVSNWLALSKAKNLNAYSSTSEANLALSYARDEATRESVNYHIDRMNKEKTNLQRQRHQANVHRRQQQRRANVISNGGYVNFGIEYLDLGVDLGFTDMFYKVGGSVRLGNYASPVQFEVGVKPGILLEYDGYYDEYEVRFVMPLYAKLKVNLCELNYSTKLFVAGLGSYDPFRNRYYEDHFACGGGIGIAKRHMDMLLYYKQDVRNCDSYNRYLALSMAYYF